MAEETMQNTQEDLDTLAKALHQADHGIALTGAGLSAASGIPTFRGEDGVWGDAFEEADFHIRRFERDPSGFWKDRLELNNVLRPDEIEPNAGHEALAELTNADVLDAVVTQNTDGLHQAAGTERVLELHGNAERVACFSCDRTKPADRIRDRVRSGENPPTCSECGGIFKPDVVLFGELLSRETLGEAKDLASKSDVILAAGSSLTVDPAASLPTYQRSGVLAVINLEETRYASRAEYTFRADVTELLPELARMVRSNDFA